MTLLSSGGKEDGKGAGGIIADYCNKFCCTVNPVNAAICTFTEE